MPNPFSAGAQALGYLYQARRGLLTLLRAPDDAQLIIEGMDDLESAVHGRVSLEQLKHQISATADLTDSSPDLWKTIRVWSTHVQSGEVDLAATTLSLITTATAPTGSVAAMLLEDNRDEVSALRRLSRVAATSTSATLEQSFRAFNALSSPEQQALVAAIRIYDQSPNILQTGDRIRELLRYATYPERIEPLYERVEGWWFAKVAKHLMEKSEVPIPRFELHDKINQIAESLRPASLPVDFRSALPDSIDVDSDTRQFVQQLRAVTRTERRIEFAIIDYYRAYEQRSRWLREDLLVDADLEEYETRLVEEWERHQAILEDEEALDRANDDSCLRFGGKLLKWMEEDAEIPIRPSVTDGFVMRGSFHMLADRVNGPVWWHPHFFNRLQSLLSAS